MKASLVSKLEVIAERYDELAALLGDQEIIQDQTKFRAYSQEYADLEDVVKCFESYQQTTAAIEDARQLLNDEDPDMRELAAEDLSQASESLEGIEARLQILLLPRDPNDKSNVFLEVRAGTGGDEAAIFAGDLFRMYSRYAQQPG